MDKLLHEVVRDSQRSQCWGGVPRLEKRGGEERAV